MRRSVSWIVLMIALLPAAGVRAQVAAWQPTEPNMEGMDWIQLTSGEWVGGTIDLIRDLTVYFDSDKLDDLSIDWDDVAAFRSPHVLTYTFSQHRIHTGTATMMDGTIRISTATGDVQMPRKQLLSVIRGRRSEFNYWSVKANLGTTLRTGNTEQKDGTAYVGIRRDATQSRFNLTYQGNVSETNGTQTVNNQRTNADFNYFVSRRFYIIIPALEFYEDEFQNIQGRISGNSGGGYYFYRKSGLEWSVGLGLGYQSTRYISVEPGEDSEYQSTSLTPSTNLEVDITSDIDLAFGYSSVIGLRDVKETTHHLTTRLSIDFLKDIFELVTSLTWDRNENPRPNEDGVVPEKNDATFTLGFGIDL